MKYKNIAIIGSNGFIGSNLTKKLREIPGINIFLFSKSKTSIFNNILPYIELDIKAESNFEKYFKNIDLIYYLSSETIPSSSWETPKIEIEKNLLPFINFLDNITSLGVKKIVFISSAGTIYGTSMIKVREDSFKNPYNPHGIIKLTMEYFLNYYYCKYNINYDIYRVANVYGEGQNTKKGLGIINTFLENIILNGKINIFGNGENVRNYVYVKDLANILSFSIFSDTVCEVYNVASNDTLSINNLTNVIKEIVTEKFEITYTPKRESDNTAIDLDNTKLLLAYPDFNYTKIEEGIKKTYEFIKNEAKNNALNPPIL